MTRDNREPSRAQNEITDPPEGWVTILYDFKTNMKPAGTGNCRNLLCMRLKRNAKDMEKLNAKRAEEGLKPLDPEAQPIMVQGTKSRAGGEIVDVLHMARVEWGVVDTKFILKGDQEGGTQCPEMRKYVRDNKSWWKRSPTDDPASKAEVESMVRYCWEGTVTVLGAGGALPSMWPLAAAFYTIQFNADIGYYPFINTAVGPDPRLQRLAPFCALGYTILPRSVYAHSTDGRGVPIALLGYDVKSSRSAQVAFFDTNRGKMRRTRVHVNDIDWVPGKYAFKKKTRDLISHYFMDPDWGLEQEGTGGPPDEPLIDWSEEDLLNPTMDDKDVIRSIPPMNPLDYELIDKAKAEMDRVGANRRIYVQCALCRQWRIWWDRENPPESYIAWRGFYYCGLEGTYTCAMPSVDEKGDNIMGTLEFVEAVDEISAGTAPSFRLWGAPTLDYIKRKL